MKQHTEEEMKELYLMLLRTNKGDTMPKELKLVKEQAIKAAATQNKMWDRRIIGRMKTDKEYEEEAAYLIKEFGENYYPDPDTDDPWIKVLR